MTISQVLFLKDTMSQAYKQKTQSLQSRKVEKKQTRQGRFLWILKTTTLLRLLYHDFVDLLRSF